MYQSSMELLNSHNSSRKITLDSSFVVYRLKTHDNDRVIVCKGFSALAANASNGSVHNIGARREVAMSTSTAYASTIAEVVSNVK